MLNNRLAASSLGRPAAVASIAAAFAGVVALPDVVSAQAEQPALQAQAFRTGSGTPTLRFQQSSGARVFQMEVQRPTRFSVEKPAGGRSLGRLEYRRADNERVRVSLRRRGTLLNNRYLLVDSRGVRVVMSTRSRARFLTLVANSRISDVKISFRGRATRMFDVRGRCTSQRFSGRFRLLGDNAQDDDTTSARSLRRTGLC